MTQPHHTHESAHEHLVEAEAMLKESLEHDFATVAHGKVPMARRRPRWHLGGLWTTFATGFAYIFLGIQIANGGYSLPATIAIAIAGHAVYVAYALGASLLGSRTGNTHGLLTRSVFGKLGTVLVGVIVVLAATGAAGFQAGLLAQALGALFHWKTVEALSLILGFVMITNNLFGFSGISMWARYIVTPVAILWVTYLVVRTAIVQPHILSQLPHGVSLPIWAAIGAIVGNDMWGNEPDIWRYGQPKLWWPLPPYAFAFFWSTLFIVGGWCTAVLAHSTDFAVQVRTMVDFSLFGFVPLAFFIIAVTQMATNDGNYYEAINVFQNLLGGLRNWRRLYGALFVGLMGFAFAWIVNYQFVNGWLKISSFLAVSIPSATTIMVVDYFLVPRIFKLRRNYDVIPEWSAMKLSNTPAFIALLGAVLVGSYASGLFPAFIESQTTYLGLVGPESWIIAAALYIAGIAIAVRRPNGAAHLGLEPISPVEEIGMAEEVTGSESDVLAETISD